MLGRVAGSSSLKTTAQAESACGTKLAPVRVEALGDRGPRGSAHRAAGVVPSNPSDLRTRQRQISPPLTTQRTRNQADHMPWLPKNLKHRSELQQPPKKPGAITSITPSFQASFPRGHCPDDSHAKSRPRAACGPLATAGYGTSYTKRFGIMDRFKCYMQSHKAPPANEHVSQTQQQWMSLWFL